MQTPVIGFNTKKTPTGYEWSVYNMVWNPEAGRGISTTLKSGKAATRAIATGKAKAWTGHFRRNGIGGL